MATSEEIEDEENQLVKKLEKWSIGTGMFTKFFSAHLNQKSKWNFLAPTFYHLFVYLSILTVLSVKTFTFLAHLS